MRWEDWREFYLELMKAWNWTPQEIAAIPIPQLVSLWLKDAAEGWQTINKFEAAEIRARKREKLLADLAAEFGRPVPIEEAREILTARREKERTDAATR